MFRAGAFLCKRCGSTHHYIKFHPGWRGDCCVRSFIEYVDELTKIKAERTLGEYGKTESIKRIKYIPHPNEPGRAGIQDGIVDGEGDEVGSGRKPTP